MSITFDHVEGVVQRDTGPAVQGGEPPAAPAQARPPAEQLEEAHHRMQWSMQRLRAD